MKFNAKKTSFCPINIGYFLTFLMLFFTGSEAFIYGLIFGKYGIEIESIQRKKSNCREAIALFILKE